MNIFTVYFSKNYKDVEMAMHFENENDAIRFEEEALNNGYIAYHLRDRVYTDFEPWMIKYLKED